MFSSLTSSHFPLLRKCTIVVRWQGLYFSKSIVFPWYSREKTDIRMAMICFMTVWGKTRHKFKFLKQRWMVYTVLYKTSSFAGYCFLGKNSIHPKRYGVFSFKAFKAVLVKIQICSFIVHSLCWRPTAQRYYCIWSEIRLLLYMICTSVRYSFNGNVIPSVKNYTLHWHNATKQTEQNLISGQIEYYIFSSFKILPL